MKILLTGSTGFIGGRLRRRLRGNGHQLVLAARRKPAGLEAGETWLSLDFADPQSAKDLPAFVEGVDVAVNAVGIFRETRRQSFDALHRRGPIALFEACAKAGVPRVVQISALGADEHARSRFHLSKRAADEALLRLPIEAVIAQPSLVFGPGGASARLFMMLASLPVLPLPAGGHQTVQPIHIDDLTTALAALVERRDIVAGRIALVGAAPLPLSQYLQQLRMTIGLGRGPTLCIPASFVAAMARLGDRLAAVPLDSDTWQMLERGNHAPAQATSRLVGTPLRAPPEFIEKSYAASVRARAQLDWLLPLLRFAVAAVWIVTGIVSLGIYPVADSLSLLARAGVPTSLQTTALYGAALLDLSLGVATLTMKRRRGLWLAQIGLILVYTLIISVRLPEFWLHPYGPVLKNLPLLAALWLLAETDGRSGKADDGV